MDAILILGAAVTPDGPSPALRRRALHGARLWHNGAAPVIIACGGQAGEGPSEAQAIEQLLLAEGVARNAIILEDQSRSTLENIQFACRLTKLKTVVIVTDRYHVRRALMVARHFGVTATPSCPQSPGLQLKNHAREALARCVYPIKLWRASKVTGHLTRD